MQTLKFILSGLISMICMQIIAQRDVAKFDLTRAAFSNIQFTHEHLLKKQDKSVGASIIFSIPKKAPFRNIFSLPDETSDAMDEIRFYGLGLAPFYRYYLFNHGQYPSGLYLSPYLKGGYNMVYGDFNASYNDGDAGILISGYFTTLGGGIDLGKQWVINEKYTLDICFLSIGAYAVSGRINAKSDVAFLAFDDYLEKTFHPWADRFGHILTSQTGDKTGEIILKQMIPNFNIGIKLGYYF